MIVIEKDKAIEAIVEVHPLDYNARAIKANIEQLPTIEIVRCRECKYHDGIRCFRWNSVIITGFDDFCSNGERREEDVKR